MGHSAPPDTGWTTGASHRIAHDCRFLSRRGNWARHTSHLPWQAENFENLNGWCLSDAEIGPPLRFMFQEIYVPTGSGGRAPPPPLLLHPPNDHNPFADYLAQRMPVRRCIAGPPWAGQGGVRPRLSAHIDRIIDKTDQRFWFRVWSCLSFLPLPPVPPERTPCRGREWPLCFFRSRFPPDPLVGKKKTTVVRRERPSSPSPPP